MYASPGARQTGMVSGRRKAQKTVTQGLDFIVRIRCHQSRIGTRKLHYLLNSQVDNMLNIGRGRLFSLLAEYQLLVPVKRTCQKAANSH